MRPMNDSTQLKSQSQRYFFMFPSFKEISCNSRKKKQVYKAKNHQKLHKNSDNHVLLYLEDKIKITC